MYTKLVWKTISIGVSFKCFAIHGSLVELVPFSIERERLTRRMLNICFAALAKRNASSAASVKSRC